MILTHLLACFAVSAGALAPAPGLLVLTDSGAGLGAGLHDPVPMPRLQVPSDLRRLPVRGH